MEHDCHQVQSSEVSYPFFTWYFLLRVQPNGTQVRWKESTCMTSSSSIVPFPSSKTNPWIEEYQQACLTRHDAGTIRVYRQILHQFTHWVGKRAGQVNQFVPSQITTPVVEQYLQELASQAYSPSHCKRVRSVIAQFCQWLIEDKALLQRNPTRGIVVDSSEPPAPFDPRILSPVQRLVLQNLVKQEDRRGKALFA